MPNSSDPRASYNQYSSEEDIDDGDDILVQMA